MGNKKIPLYPVMLITGIAVTIFSLSLLGIAVITGYLPIAQPDTPAVRDSASDPQHPIALRHHHARSARCALIRPSTLTEEILCTL